MYCIIKCIVQGKQARVKNADLRHPSCAVVMQKRKSASPVLNVLTIVPPRTTSNIQGMYHYNTVCCIFFYYIVNDFMFYCSFIVSLLGIISNVFYQTDCTGEAPSVALFILYCTPHEDGNVMKHTRRPNGVCMFCLCVWPVFVSVYTGGNRTAVLN